MYSVTRLMGFPVFMASMHAKHSGWVTVMHSGCREVTWLEVKSYFRAQYEFIELLTCSLSSESLAASAIRTYMCRTV